MENRQFEFDAPLLQDYNICEKQDDDVIKAAHDILEPSQICKICGIKKELSEFKTNGTSKVTGLKRYYKQCKKCMAIKQAEYNAEYRRTHKDEKAEHNAEYYRTHKDEMAEHNAEYYRTRKDEIAEYRRTHKDEIAEYNRTHKEEIAEYKRTRIKNDPAFKLLCNIRSRMNQMLKKASRTKNFKTKSALLKHCDWTMEQYVQHIESLFEPWMNWNNMGKYNSKTHATNPTWNIDHIIPLAYWDDYDYGCNPNGPNFMIAWSLKNLRPLDAYKNNCKNDSMTEETEKLLAELELQYLK